MSRLISPLAIGLVLLALAHAVFAWRSRDLRPDFQSIAPPPSVGSREVLSFGDHQFLYRAWALDLQNTGDTGGRITPMGRYNYDYVMGWLESLRALDYRAHHHAFLAANYFVLTPNAADARRIVDFIVRDATAAPEQKWIWLAQATSLAETRLRDLPYALEIAERVTRYDFADTPPWILMFPAVLLEKMGRYPEARAFVEDIQLRKQNILTPDDTAWAEDFLHRLPASP